VEGGEAVVEKLRRERVFVDERDKKRGKEESEEKKGKQTPSRDDEPLESDFCNRQIRREIGISEIRGSKEKKKKKKQEKAEGTRKEMQQSQRI
jgi:hypothetical protein